MMPVAGDLEIQFQSVEALDTREAVLLLTAHGAKYKMHHMI